MEVALARIQILDADMDANRQLLRQLARIRAVAIDDLVKELGSVKAAAQMLSMSPNSVSRARRRRW